MDMGKTFHNNPVFTPGDRHLLAMFTVVLDTETEGSFKNQTVHGDVMFWFTETTLNVRIYNRQGSETDWNDIVVPVLLDEDEKIQGVASLEIFG
jgi:hypothetical protein